MIVVVLQIFFALAVIILIILFVFQPRKKRAEFLLTEEHKQLLLDYVRFYQKLDEEGKRKFEERVEQFLSSVKITAVNAEVEDIDIILIGAAAIIPVYFITDWQYINLREILVYPGSFNHDFEQHGQERSVSGMVGTGALQNVMIITKWELRQGFISNNYRNTAIHEFVHLIDKMDGAVDGVPELLLPRKFVPQWQQLINSEIEKIRRGESDIDPYGATNPAEFFAVVAEYFFELPELFSMNHPELNEALERIFWRKWR